MHVVYNDARLPPVFSWKATTISTPQLRFDTTQWSLVARAGSRSTPAGRQAFGDLCQSYWVPLYAYLRIQGNDPDTAQDLVQSFFLRVIEKEVISQADAKRGRFRTFLLIALRNHVRNERARETTLKRGGVVPKISLSWDVAEDRFRGQNAKDFSPEQLYEQQWVRDLLAKALRRVRDEYAFSGRLRLYEIIKPELVISGDGTSESLGRQLGMSAGAVRIAIHRLRAQFRRSVRLEIAATVGEDVNLDDEVEQLFAAFSKKDP
ncbi:MAG: sigma-70 family RNA polymerase sigma factor [Planctomycetota bacterium]